MYHANRLYRVNLHFCDIEDQFFSFGDLIWARDPSEALNVTAQAMVRHYGLADDPDRKRELVAAIVSITRTQQVVDVVDDLHQTLQVLFQKPIESELIEDGESLAILRAVLDNSGIKPSGYALRVRTVIQQKL
jgi:hypothetical protein